MADRPWKRIWPSPAFSAIVSKAADVATVSERTRQLCRLFNPRTDRWPEHFRLDGARIVGITEIGEATAALLGFNHPDRLLEREVLLHVGRYPSSPARRIMGIG